MLGQAFPELSMHKFKDLRQRLTFFSDLGSYPDPSFAFMQGLFPIFCKVFWGSDSIENHFTEIVNLTRKRTHLSASIGALQNEV
jgi:hypothetical protein